VKKLILPIGISGSGKSTYIRKNFRPEVIVNPDTIRKELTGNISDHSKDPYMWTQVVPKRLSDTMEKYGEAVLDATNVKSSERTSALKSFGSDVKKIAIVFYVEPEVVKSRIKKDIETGVDRSNVPDYAVDRQYQNFLNGLQNIEKQFDEVITIDQRGKENQLKETITNVDIESLKDLDAIDEIIEAALTMGKDNPILYRGMAVPRLSTSILHMVQDRDFFRGGNLGAKTIMKYLGIKDPIFTYSGYKMTIRLFGKAHAVVMKKPYRLFQSPEVDDVMAWAQPIIYKETEENGGLLRSQVGVRTPKQQVALALKGAKTFVELKDTNPLPNNIYNEILVDAREYWAIDVMGVIRQAGKFVKDYEKSKPSKGFARDYLEYVETYGELAEILTTYKKFTAWKFKNPRPPMTEQKELQSSFKRGDKVWMYLKDSSAPYDSATVLRYDEKAKAYEVQADSKGNIFTLLPTEMEPYTNEGISTPIVRRNFAKIGENKTTIKKSRLYEIIRQEIKSVLKELKYKV
jgi:predicted kinase